MQTSGSTLILRKYFPLPVTRKYSPAKPGTLVPIGVQLPGAFKRGLMDSTSSGFKR